MAQRNFKPSHKTKDIGRTFNGRKHIDAMYDAKWEAYRKRFLKLNHECYACGKPANVVDHVTSHRGDETLFKKTDNHIPLCTTCHNTVTGLFDQKETLDVEKKIAWLNRKRMPTESWTPKRVKVIPYDE